MRKLWLVLTFGALSSGLQAQADSARRETGEVAGSVYDSVTAAPVAGAVIQLVLAADPDREVHGATSDAKGRFAIVGVKPGRYLIGFLHDALDSLALETPLRVVVVRAGELTKVELAVPSPATILTAACGPVPKADSTGLMLGMLRDARTRLPFDTGSVEVAWQEIAFTTNKIDLSDKRANATVTKAGWFAVCGIPGGVDVAVIGRHDSDSTGTVAFTVPIGGVARRDLFLGGTASIRGLVRTERNQPLANARVAIAGRERMATTDSGGAFHLNDIPAGSQTAEIRALGYAPELRTLVLPAASDTTLDVTLTSVKKVMDTIRVLAQRVYNRDSNGFLRRKRMGGGHYFDQATVQRERPYDVSRMLFKVPSLRVDQRGFNRRILMRGGFAGGYCTPAFYLNGMKMPSDLLGELDFMVRPEELDGMEVYRGGSAPAQFSDFGGCGSIVVWTRAPVIDKKK
jgi:hypothetical protein